MNSTYDFLSKDLDIDTNNFTCTLFDDKNTTCIFTTNFDKTQSQNTLVFKPFTRQTQFIYHEYEISCSLTRDIEDDAVSSLKSSIVQKAQKIYDCCFTNSPYKFTFKETDVLISQKRKGLHENDDNSTLSTSPQNQHSSNISQAQIGYEEGSPVLVISQTQHECHENLERSSSKKRKMVHNQSQKEIQESYQQAYKNGLLRKLPCKDENPLPILGSCWDYSKTWSPYLLTSGKRHSLMLNNDKLQKVKKIRTAVEESIPKAKEWDTMAEAQGLGCEDIEEILKFTKRSEYIEDVEPRRVSFQEANLGDQALQLIGLANAWVQNADKVLKTGRLFRRVGMIRKLIGYSIFRVAEFSMKGKKQVAKDINEKLLGAFGSHERRHREQRDAVSLWCWAMAILPGWKGRELALYIWITESKLNILQRCNKRSIPALAGEFVAALEAKGQQYDNSSSLRIPGVVSIVEDLLAGIVSKETIYQALGCPYLPRPSENIQFTFVGHNDPTTMTTLAKVIDESHPHTSEHTPDGGIDYNDRSYDSHNNSLVDPNSHQHHYFEQGSEWWNDMDNWNWKILDGQQFS